MSVSNHHRSGQNPQHDATGRYSINAELSDLASAVTALTADELAGLSHSLSSSDGWDSGCADESGAGSFLSNLF